MPWKKSDGTVIQTGKSWVDDNKIRHPSNWNIWTDDYKKSMGLTWEDPLASEAPYDDRFYSGRKSDGSLIEKSLTDVDAVDAEGKAVLNPITGKQEIILGLKSIWIAQTKATAQEKLNKHDWMIVRNAEKSTAIPSDVTTYRDAVRTKCTSIETAINNCSNLTNFIALFDVPVDSDGMPTGNAPINDFPDEI
tara:strand:+ start:222 stop:797 length:576 start_codon:yes stop_codon:yes gene_type:complete